MFIRQLSYWAYYTICRPGVADILELLARKVESIHKRVMLGYVLCCVMLFYYVKIEHYARHISQFLALSCKLYYRIRCNPVTNVSAMAISWPKQESSCRF